MSNSDYKVLKGYPEEIRDQIIDLSEEFDCPIPIVVALYELMLDDLYDEIPTALEDDWPDFQEMM